MNKALYLKGSFISKPHPPAHPIPSLPVNETVTSEHVKRLALQFGEVKRYWETDRILGSVLVSVHYTRVIPKSKQIKMILSGNGKKADACIRGARFEEKPDKQKDVKFNKRHVITYNVSKNVLKETIDKLNVCSQILDRYYNGKIDKDLMSEINKGKYSFTEVPKTVFLGTIVDCNSIDYVNVEENTSEIKAGSLISLYLTDISTKDILRKIGIDIQGDRMLDESTVRLYRDEIDLLQSTAPYLISMLNDFSEYDLASPDNPLDDNSYPINIPIHSDEPIIGVLDTQFDKRVYFGDWVEYTNEISDDIDIDSKDYFHGTAVSSIIVDGPNIDPRLDDGCGRFRVRHFGVAKDKGTGSFEILKKIESIVRNNSYIKVWNLSLGSMLEVPENCISAEASILDRIQSMYDVIFIIAGTNDLNNTKKKRIGSPADSINSIVVNAVNSNGESVSYARRGPVLEFFLKPDVSCYGGDTRDYMRVCGPLGEATVTGTSFAAPWITRKVAFLIYKMGLNRELAKALIIDSAAGWKRKDKPQTMIGYGVVPTHINDILETPEDEIKFFITGIINDYETYNYTIPVPIFNGMQPFWSRATLVYFPYCDRNQGVDYTSTEVDIHFGRVYKKGDSVQIKEINNNKQAYEGTELLYEEKVRQLYRKWDNVKLISEICKRNSRPKKVYEAGLWGLKVVTKERNDEKMGRGMPFGVVVTLKEMKGMNRINDFIKLCGMYGWLVNTVDVDSSIDLYNKTDADIMWE